MKYLRFLRWLIWIPLLAVMVVFALANRKHVEMDLFPADLTVEVPLSVAILSAMAVGFFFGGLVVWFASLRHRRAANRSQRTARLLEAKNQELSARRPGLLLAPPG